MAKTKAVRIQEVNYPIKVSIRELANGDRRFDVTAKGHTEKELRDNLDVALKMAVEKCTN